MLQNVTHSELPVNIESTQCDPMAPKGIDILSPGQCRAARAWLNWSAKELGERAKVHRMTVQRFEQEESSPIAATVEQIRIALQKAGCEFPDADTVRLPPRKKGPTLEVITDADD